MRSIAKGAEPRELIQWRTDNRATPQNLVYGGGGFPAEAVRTALLAEQFHLCAYTLRRLKTPAQCHVAAQDTRASCHIEHLLPQSRRQPGEDIDYQNMVACYPPSQSSVACEFGAQVKADFDPSAGGFVSPLSTGVEAQFDFDERGGVAGRTEDGRRTIGILKLDHKVLVDDRAAAIRGYLHPRGQPLSAQAALRVANEVMQPDAQGCLPAYCVAVAQAARRHADRQERRATRMRGQRRP